MEPSNLTSRTINTNNGYRLLHVSNNVEYDNSCVSKSNHSRRGCLDSLTESSGDDDSYTDGSDEARCTEDDLEEWQRKVDSKGELFFIQTYSENNQSRSISSSSSSENKSSKMGVGNQDLKSEELGILSSLLWKNKQPHIKKSKRKKHSVGSVDTMGEKTENLSKNDHFRKMLLEVEIALHQRRPTLGRGVSAFEGYVGLVLKRIFKNDRELLCEDFVVISNIIPDSPASAIDGISIGDRIVAINDVELNFSNLEQLSHMALAPDCKQIKLGLCRLVPITPKENKQNRFSTSTSAAFVPTLLNNSDQNLSEFYEFIISSSCLALYLNLNCKINDQMDDIIYQFPKGQNKLVKVRGAFVTHVNLLLDIVGSKAHTCSLLIDSKLIHVAYASDINDKLLLVALPGDCISSSMIRDVVDEITSSLTFQYGTLEKAFGTLDQRSQIDLLFTLMFTKYMSGETSTQLEDIKNARFGYRSRFPQQLHLFSDLQICVDTILNEFESSDFADMSEDHYDIRRLYSIIGVSLYYKGYLISDHLINSLSKEVFLYLLHCGMLDTSRQHLTNTVVWKEIFPSERKIDDGNFRRNFLLVVGKHHFLLAVVLETGGCASRVVGTRAPDPFYVDRAQNTLLQLQLHQATTSLNSLLENPSISCAAHLKGRNNNCCSDRKSETGSRQNASSRSFEWQNSDGIVESDSDSISLLSNAASGTSDDTAPILGRRMQHQANNEFYGGHEADQSDENHNKSVAGHRQRHLPSFLDLSTIMDSLPLLTNERNVPPARLLSGSQNVLFNYLQISRGPGVIICPVVQTNAVEQSWPLKSILKNFERGCEMISRFLINNESVVEQAMMFKCSKVEGKECLRESDSFSYWIVGRVIRDPIPREFYVCYQDCCPQVLIEIAFRLNFGVVI